ncbi:MULTISPECIES: universal stress protein [Actinomadura]|uniref:Universal stress protein n=1 Tax=Actinomadura yumaensis TaxID=111807 RepID=A0ABW2CRP3_9ACTN|nr:universal stress protein [Actinomadura sp. J1-007]
MTELVIVGYDGSAESEAALHWGVDEACARRLPLMLCHAWRWPYPAEYADRDTKTIVQRMGRNILERGGAVAGDLAPGLEVRTLLVDGPACAGLLTESDEASLIVIGSHDPDAVPIGSTALQLPGRAPGPVIVVRRAGSAERRIVAGADGSPGGDAALGFAFGEAELRGWCVQAVYGYWDPGVSEDLSLYSDLEELRRASGARLERAVAPWRDRYPRVPVRTSLVPSQPRSALMEAASGADLIVVGARGSADPHPLDTGITTMTLLRRAACPVAVVRADGADA